MYRPGNFIELPVVVKNLLIINGLLFLATISLKANFDYDITKYFGLHQFQSPDFRPYQLITHLFMHANLTHLFFNMFALWMFGKILENIWGEKRALFSLTFPSVYNLNFVLNSSVSIQSPEESIAIFLKKKIILFENQFFPTFLVIEIIIFIIKFGS